MGKEDAINRVKEFYDSEHTAKFEDGAWKVKVEGF